MERHYMGIVRYSPDVGYLSSELFNDLGVSQIVRAGSMFYFSGIVAMNENREVQGRDNPAIQVGFVLDILKKLLVSQGLTFKNLVTITIYTPDMDKLYGQMPQLSEAFCKAPPCMNVIGVRNLALPDLILELVATAYSA